jgi:hypothetical protein
MNDIAKVQAIQAYGPGCFKRRDYERMMSRISQTSASKQLIYWVTMSFRLFKILVDSFPDEYTYSSARFLFSLLLTPEGQEIYEEFVTSQSHDLQEDRPGFYVRTKRGNTSSMRPPETREAYIARKFPTQDWSGKNYLTLLKLHTYMADVPSDIWPSANFGPLWDVTSLKASKMYLTEKETPSRDILKFFRMKIKDYLRKYSPSTIVVPPPFTHAPFGGKRHYDGVEAKFDYEKTNFGKHGFLYQKFMTSHNTVREVWLPDRPFKLMNAWWTAIGKQITDAIPYSTIDLTPEEAWAKVRHRINNNSRYFDLTGFGLQYPREYMIVILEEISSLYEYDETLQDMSKMLIDYLKDISVNMGGYDKHIHPNRGIGLGYLENLKTLGVFALMDSFDPVAGFGDQMILRDNILVIENLSIFGFFLKDTTKTFSVGEQFKWSGSTFTKEKLETPKSFWTDISGAFRLSQHWERKQALQSAFVPGKYEHAWKRIAHAYSDLFGYEFHRGEACQHPKNGGVLPTADEVVGWTRWTLINQLPLPRAKSSQLSLFSSHPERSRLPVGVSLRFSKTRRKLWDKAIIAPSYYFDYINPVLEYNQKNRKILNLDQRCSPTWAEVRSLLFLGTHNGKLLYNLNDEEIRSSLLYQRFAFDPFYARASGGYKIITIDHCIKGVSQEMENLAEFLIETRNAFTTRLYRSDRLPTEVRYDWTRDKPSRVRESRFITQNPYTTVSKSATQDVQSLVAMLNSMVVKTFPSESDVVQIVSGDIMKLLDTIDVEGADFGQDEEFDPIIFDEDPQIEDIQYDPENGLQLITRVKTPELVEYDYYGEQNDSD